MKNNFRKEGVVLACRLGEVTAECEAFAVTGQRVASDQLTSFSVQAHSVECSHSGQVFPAQFNLSGNTIIDAPVFPW